MTSLYGPQNIFSKALPGRLGALLGINDSLDSWRNSVNLVSITEEALTIRIYGPQVINENNFIKAYGSAYDSNLDSLVLKK